jgi:hypothetical protein
VTQTTAKPSLLVWLIAPLYSWRAAAGAKLMDIKVPGWFSRVDTERLDLCDNDDCIVGQTVGNFNYNSEKVLGRSNDTFLGTVRMVRYGFVDGFLRIAWLISRELRQKTVTSSPRLKMAWIYQIDKRLAAERAAFASVNEA